MTGAIFCERRPATIIKSAWRGEGRKTSAPKRARSKRAAAMDIISIAQQANPKPSGQMELLRAQFTALSSVVKMMPSSSRSLPKSSGLVSVTCLPSDVLMVFRLRYFRTADGWRQIAISVSGAGTQHGIKAGGQVKPLQLLVERITYFYCLNSHSLGARRRTSVPRYAQ